MSDTPPSTADWVRWMARPVGRAERERAALHVLDWLACASAGSRTPQGLAMASYARSLGPGPCPTLAGLSLSEGDAALVNGSLGNVLEMDDFYRTAIVHPGPVLVPAALAMAQATGASGAHMLDALVKGFEIMIRLGRSVGPAHYRYFHNTATCGVFGAAAVGAALLKLEASAMRDAFGNAGTQASGLWQCRLEDTMSKQLHNGRAAQSGLLAARLAQHGFTGAHAILEGELGFFRAMCPDAQANRMAGGDEDRWLIHDTSFKPWPACRHAHAVIDLALALRPQLQPSEIVSVDVHSYRDAVHICDKPEPRTPVEAKFSLQHAAAVCLMRGAPGLADFDVPATQDPVVAQLRSRVRLHEDPALSGVYPAHFGASMAIALRDGRRLQAQVSDALGDPELPLSLAQLHAKAHMLLAATDHSRDHIEAIIADCAALVDAPSVADVARWMR